MTLKQFFQLAGGLLISLLFYATGLHPVVKWPLIILFGLGGAALAFLPFEERPLSQWIVSFFKSVYSPTEYYWQPTEADRSFFQPESQATQAAEETKSEEKKEGQGVVFEGGTKPTQHSFASRLDEIEHNILSRVGGVFAGFSAAAKPSPQTPPPVQQTPPPQQEEKREVAVVESTPTPIATQGFRPQIVVEEKQKEVEAPKTLYQESKVAPAVQTSQPAQGQAVAAQFSSDAAPPSPPIAPNTITGQVLDNNGKIVEGAILEVKDAAGRPVRALKSNKLGHFMIVTSLPDGNYDLVTEKEGLEFDSISFEAKGDMIPSIAIRAKNAITN